MRCLYSSNDIVIRIEERLNGHGTFSVLVEFFKIFLIQFLLYKSMAFL